MHGAKWDVGSRIIIRTITAAVRHTDLVNQIAYRGGVKGAVVAVAPRRGGKVVLATTHGPTMRSLAGDAVPTASDDGIGAIAEMVALLADHDRIAGAVGDIGQANFAIGEENASAADSTVAGVVVTSRVAIAKVERSGNAGVRTDHRIDATWVLVAVEIREA